MSIWARLATLVGLLATGVLILVLVQLPDISELRDRVAAAGAWGPVVFVGVYVVATLLLLPKNVLTAAAGLVFGLPVGVALVWVGAMLGASAAFWLGRHLGRDGVARLAGRHLTRLDALVLRHGAPAVLVARLIPVVPFTAVNYGSGVTAVPFSAYLLATAVGILPGTVAYVAFGAFGTDPTGWPFLTAVGGLLLLTVGGWWFARRRHRAASSGGTRADRAGGRMPDPTADGAPDVASEPGGR